MKSYELTYLISPELSLEELKPLQEKINSLIQKEGGALDEISLPTKKRLAFSIKKNKEAFLADLSFHLEPTKLKNLERELKSENKILRYLILFNPPIRKTVFRERRIPRIEVAPKIPIKEKKVELKKIEEKLEEILGE